MNQLHGCKRCTESTKMCPNAEKKECVDRVIGQFFREGWDCPFCPPGTFAQKETNANAHKCEPCPKGKYSPGKKDSCEVCDTSEKKYTPAQGFAECLTCGGHVADDKCSACPEGQGIFSK